MSEPTKTNQLLFGTADQIFDEQTEADFLKIFERAAARKNYYGTVESPQAEQIDQAQSDAQYSDLLKHLHSLHDCYGFNPDEEHER